MSDGQTVVRAREPLEMQAARVSWIIPIVVGGLNVMHSSANKAPGSFSDWGARWGQLVVSGFSMAALLAGVVCAAGALIGLRGREAGGRKAEAAAGLAINGLMVLAFVVAVLIGAALTGMRHRPVDHSYSASWYEGWGMPAPVGGWDGADYGRAVAALKSASLADPNSLPRWKSRNSAAVFEHITDVRNLATLGATPAERVQNLPGMAEPLEGCMQVYVDAMGRGAIYDDEVTELEDFEMKLVDQEVQDLNMIVAGIPAGDARRAKAAAVMERMKEPLMKVVSGAIDSLAARPVTGRACQVRLAGYAKRDFPPLLRKMSAGDRATAVARVERLRDEASGDYRAALAELARVMEAER